MLAKEIGVSQTHMSNIESGRAGLTLENLVKMSKIFNCGIDEIVFGEVEKKQEQGVDVLKNCTMQDIIQAMQMLKSLKNWWRYALGLSLIAAAVLFVFHNNFTA